MPSLAPREAIAAAWHQVVCDPTHDYAACPPAWRAELLAQADIFVAALLRAGHDQLDLDAPQTVAIVADMLHTGCGQILRSHALAECAPGLADIAVEDARSMLSTLRGLLARAA